ncbi:hypothetical protein FNF31_06283 [Cafeteria roenbergensis]|nr:hypothetical protein FNF31_06283 [Cafeteria roenbergensis]KAA0168646.1 hypothetical protein FNF28_02386 [Cafeteria roenbergensis]|mmetsp:Transcript_13595/g.51886  ORF Transcript_13595/g.51886 Transcript_13595/m.51886 type:complete len:111 (-) Transcript_13595:155-487(-)
MEMPAWSETARDWCKENPLKATVGIWGVFMVATISKLARKGMRPSLVLIHARMYAQFAVIFGMGAAGLVTYLNSEGSDRRSSVKLRLKQFDPEPAPEAVPVVEAEATDRA